MSDDHANPLDHPDVQAASTVRYVAAFAVALGFTITAALITVLADLSLVAAFIELSVIGFTALVIQLYLLFKLDIAQSRIWHTVSLVMTMPLLFMAITLTQWMFYNLSMRVMPSGMM